MLKKKKALFSFFSLDAAALIIVIIVLHACKSAAKQNKQLRDFMTLIQVSVLLIRSSCGWLFLFSLFFFFFWSFLLKPGKNTFPESSFVLQDGAASVAFSLLSWIWRR